MAVHRLLVEPKRKPQLGMQKLQDMPEEFQATLPDIKWERFNTILLDMDGTVLDLAFDNYFWRELVPQVYAERQKISEDAAREAIYDRYAGREGTLEWYCLDFWAEQLELDLMALKRACRDRICFLPGAREFLTAVRARNKRLVLVTNAHRQAMELKKSVVGLDEWFDEFVCAHDLGAPKEHLEFWHKLEALLGFDPTTTLFIDDSIPVLNTAVEYGLGAVIAVRRPDTGKPAKDTEGHHFVEGIAHLV